MSGPRTEAKPVELRVDRFGNTIDPAVGYARGAILAGARDEALRDAHGRGLLRERVARHGPGAVAIFSGSRCDYPVPVGDLEPFGNEAVGPALFEPALREAALRHMGGGADDQVAVLNRTSAGIVAASLALAAPGSTVVSVVGAGASHPSVRRGAALARCDLLELEGVDGLGPALARSPGQLVIVTAVTSEIDVMPESDLCAALALARAAGRVTLVDDAYGARVRTGLYGQRPARGLGADLAITSCQKAGLVGPRAGLLVGDADLVAAVKAAAMELGQEARGPIALGVWRCLEAYRDEDVRDMAAVGDRLHQALTARFGPDRVAETPLGPLLDADDLLDLAVARAGSAAPPAIVPAEASAVLGLSLLVRHGILTVNAASSPGARISLRLKAGPADLRRAGGAERVVDAVHHALDDVARCVHDAERARSIIFGADRARPRAANPG